jgi:hypothetical protein
VNLIDNEASLGVRGVITALRAGKTFPPLIAAEGTQGELILIEGHTRATAHAFLQTPEVEFFVGSSPLISRWAFY